MCVSGTRTDRRAASWWDPPKPRPAGPLSSSPLWKTVPNPDGCFPTPHRVLRGTLDEEVELLLRVYDVVGATDEAVRATDVKVDGNSVESQLRHTRSINALLQSSLSSLLLIAFIPALDVPMTTFPQTLAVAFEGPVVAAVVAAVRRVRGGREKRLLDRDVYTIMEILP